MHRHTLSFVFLFVPTFAHANYPARVMGVTDGDTVTVLRADRTQVRVRLHGIDAPENGQDFGMKAKQALSGMAFGKDVTVREVEKDRYGRTVAEVILPDGRSLNQEMVSQGMAWWYRQYAPNDRELSRLESEAKAASRGLWSQAKPTPPWEWRKPRSVDSGQVIGNRKSRVYHAANCRVSPG